MNVTHLHWKLAPALAAALLAAACGGTSSTSNSSSPIATALASATSASGTLLCTPNQAQIDACTGLAAGAACTLSTTLGSTTLTTAGTCRATVDGATVGCAPNPPAPPQALVDACASKASGDACSATEPDGDVHTGVCVTARDGATLVCGRVHTPPQVAIDACASEASGDACTVTETDGRTFTGVCTLGPASTGALACSRAQDLRPSATAACSGLAAGATCTIGERHGTLSGTCVTPAAGGDAVCVAACADLGGEFRCGPGGDGGFHGGMMPGGHH